MLEEDNPIVKKKKNILVPIIVAAVLLIAVIVIVILVVSSSGKSVNDKLALGDRYLSELDYDKAIAAYKEVLDIDPENADAYLGIAKAYEGQGIIENAIATLEEGYMVVKDERLTSMMEELRLKLAAKMERMPDNEKETEKREESAPKNGPKTEDEILEEYKDLIDFWEEYTLVDIPGVSICYFSYEERQNVYGPMISRLKEFISDPGVFYEGSSYYHPERFDPQKVVVGIDGQCNLIMDGITTYWVYSDIPSIDEAYALLYYWQMVVGDEEDARDTRREYAELIGRQDMSRDGYTVEQSKTFDAYGRMIEDSVNGLVFETTWDTGICYKSKDNRSEKNGVIGYNSHTDYEYDEAGRMILSDQKSFMREIFTEEEIAHYRYDRSGEVSVTGETIGPEYKHTNESTFKLDRFGRKRIL